MSHAPTFVVARRLGQLLVIALVLAFAGCAAPSTSNDVAPANAVAGTGTPASTRQDPPRPSPAPGGPNASGTVEIDRSCSSDAECTVKDVGNCCGYYPACVNVDSPTDPEGVKAQCAKSGMASVCGFPAITSCQCVAGECKGSSQALLE